MTSQKFIIKGYLLIAYVDYEIKKEKENQGGWQILKMEFRGGRKNFLSFFVKKN